MKVSLAWLAVLCLVQVQAGDEVHHLRGDSKATPAPKQEEGTVAKEPDTEGKEVPATATAVTAAPKVEPEVGAVAKEPESAKGTETEAPQQTGKGAGVVVKEPAAKQPDTVKPEGPSAGVVEPEPIYPGYYPMEDEWEGFDYPEWEDERAYWEDVDGYPYEEEIFEGPGPEEVGVAVKELDPEAQAAAAPASFIGRRPGRGGRGRRPGRWGRRPGRWGRRPGRWGRRPGRWGRRPYYRPRPYYYGGGCLRWAYTIYGSRYCAWWR